MSASVRSPAVAGLFYPADARVLATMVDDFLAAAEPLSAAATPPKVLVVPHAGYIYSGAVAAAAYATLQQCAGVRRVIVLGPNHRVALRGMAVPTCDAFATPLGRVNIDDELRARVSMLPGVVREDAPHVQEHALEVQLPFLQRVLGDFTWLPVVVGEVDAESVATLLEAVWGGDETLIVISTDLSHYLPYDLARAVDNETVAMIQAHRAQLQLEQACGAHPLNGALRILRSRQMPLHCVALANSGDTAGDRDRVVGYGAFIA